MDTTISPDPATARDESEDLFDEEADYELEIELHDRTVTMDVIDGEPVALSMPDGRVMAQLTVTEK